MRHLCTEEEITVRLRFGKEQIIPVYRYRELAVNKHSFPGFYVIYVPDGTAIDDNQLQSVNDALSILFAVDKLRNNWLEISDQEWVDMLPPLLKIWAENGYPSSGWKVGTGYGYSSINGY